VTFTFFVAAIVDHSRTVTGRSSLEVSTKSAPIGPKSSAASKDIKALTKVVSKMAQKATPKKAAPARRPAPAPARRPASKPAPRRR
jgi:hypothetical protein